MWVGRTHIWVEAIVREAIGGRVYPRRPVASVVNFRGGGVRRDSDELETVAAKEGLFAFGIDSHKALVELDTREGLPNGHGELFGRAKLARELSEVCGYLRHGRSLVPSHGFG